MDKKEFKPIHDKTYKLCEGYGITVKQLISELEKYPEDAVVVGIIDYQYEPVRNIIFYDAGEEFIEMVVVLDIDPHS